MQLIHFVLIVAFSFLSGCVPFISHDFFQPEPLESSEKNYITKAFCYRVFDKPLRGHGTTGPPSRIVYPISGILFSTSIVNEALDILNFNISIGVPQGFNVQMQSSKIMLFDPEMKLKALLAIEGYTTSRMIGESSEFDNGQLVIIKEFIFEVNSPKPLPDEFILLFPKIIVNDTSLEIPKIKFKREKSMEYFMPINC